MAEPEEIDISEESGESAPHKKRSDIWEYFKLKEDDGKKFAVCTKCPNKSFIYSGGTSTLWKHLKNVHFILKPKPKEDAESTSSIGNLFAKQQESKQVSIGDAFARYDLFSLCFF